MKASSGYREGRHPLIQVLRFLLVLAVLAGLTIGIPRVIFADAIKRATTLVEYNSALSTAQGLAILILMVGLSLMATRVGYRWFDCLFGLLPIFGLFYIVKFCWRFASLPHDYWNVPSIESYRLGTAPSVAPPIPPPVPGITDTSLSETHIAEPEGRPSSRRRWITAGVLVLVAIGVSVPVWIATKGDRVPDAASPSPSPSPTVTPTIDTRQVDDFVRRISLSLHLYYVSGETKNFEESVATQSLVVSDLRTITSELDSATLGLPTSTVDTLSDNLVSFAGAMKALVDCRKKSEAGTSCRLLGDELFRRFKSTHNALKDFNAFGTLSVARLDRLIVKGK